MIFIRKTCKPSYEKLGAYRPISITSYVGKLLEKLICFRLQNHFSSIKLLDENQEGFTKQRNTIRYLNRLDMLIQSGNWDVANRLSEGRGCFAIGTLLLDYELSRWE